MITRTEIEKVVNSKERINPVVRHYTGYKASDFCNTLNHFAVGTFTEEGYHRSNPLNLNEAYDDFNEAKNGEYPVYVCAVELIDLAKNKTVDYWINKTFNQ